MRSVVFEAAVYTAIVLVGTLVYIALVKYGIPWYYCHYYSVCIFN